MSLSTYLVCKNLLNLIFGDNFFAIKKYGITHFSILDCFHDGFIKTFNFTKHFWKFCRILVFC